MSAEKNTRITRELTPAEQERFKRDRDLIAKELPDLILRDQMRKEAKKEPTLSGELGRAIHANEQDLSDIASQAGITPIQLDEFLTDERPLRSDVMDRLATALAFNIQVP